MDNQIIQQVWRIEQEILDVIHERCCEENIKYSLFYGTLIGAVRHKGFIPWDDDIDIVMPRIDYERFKKAWEDNPVAGYVLQDYNTDSDYPNNFMKLRKNNTTFLQFEEEKSKQYHKGIFVDIFPADRIAVGYIHQKIQYVASAINLLYSREFESGTGGIIGIIEKVLLMFPKSIHPVFRNKAEAYIKRWNTIDSQPFYCGCTIGSCKKYYPANMFDALKVVDFCGKQYYSVRDTHIVLRNEYGNYMELPPEDERIWKHHPITIDFTHNFEEIDKDVNGK